jgi:poly(A) polymerase
MAPVEALGIAGDEVLVQQATKVAIHRRFAVMAREIWCMQPRFDKQQSRRAQRMVNERRFRAAYDFLLLRVLEQPELEASAQWWTEFQADPANARAQDGGPDHASEPGDDDAPAPAKRRRRRRRRGPPKAP